MIYYSIIPESLTTVDFEKIYSDISPLLPDFRRKKAEGRKRTESQTEASAQTRIKVMK